MYLIWSILFLFSNLKKNYLYLCNLLVYQSKTKYKFNILDETDTHHAADSEERLTHFYVYVDICVYLLSFLLWL